MKKPRKYIGVICKDAPDFNYLMVSLGAVYKNYTSMTATIGSVKYVRLTKAVDTCSWSFDAVITTLNAIENVEFDCILDCVKPAIKPIKTEKP